VVTRTIFIEHVQGFSQIMRHKEPSYHLTYPFKESNSATYNTRLRKNFLSNFCLA